MQGVVFVENPVKEHNYNDHAVIISDLYLSQCRVSFARYGCIVSC